MPSQRSHEKTKQNIILSTEPVTEPENPVIFKKVGFTLSFEDGGLHNFKQLKLRNVPGSY